MNVSYTLHGIKFEWDSRKAAANLRKHGVAFETACEVFFDPFLCGVGEEMVEGEPREVVMGLTVNWRLLYVAYTLRGEVVRIISARPATRQERKKYEDQ
jgi:hypothetical protein